MFVQLNDLKICSSSVHFRTSKDFVILSSVLQGIVVYSLKEMMKNVALKMLSYLSKNSNIFFLCFSLTSRLTTVVNMLIPCWASSRILLSSFLFSSLLFQVNSKRSLSPSLVLAEEGGTRIWLKLQEFYSDSVWQFWTQTSSLQIYISTLILPTPEHLLHQNLDHIE